MISLLSVLLPLFLSWRLAGCQQSCFAEPGQIRPRTKLSCCAASKRPLTARRLGATTPCVGSSSMPPFTRLQIDLGPGRDREIRQRETGLGAECHAQPWRPRPGRPSRALLRAVRCSRTPRAWHSVAPSRCFWNEGLNPQGEFKQARNLGTTHLSRAVAAKPAGPRPPRPAPRTALGVQAQLAQQESGRDTQPTSLRDPPVFPERLSSCKAWRPTVSGLAVVPLPSSLPKALRPPGQTSFSHCFWTSRPLPAATDTLWPRSVRESQSLSIAGAVILSAPCRSPGGCSPHHLYPLIPHKSPGNT